MERSRSLVSFKRKQKTLNWSPRLPEASAGFGEDLGVYFLEPENVMVSQIQIL